MTYKRAKPGDVNRSDPGVEFMRSAIIILILTLAISLAGCRGAFGRMSSPAAPDACSLALAPHTGDAAIDQEIARLQAEARKAPDPSRPLERLGWSFVQKARVSFDPGFYKLAESCALCSESRNPGRADAILLRGHVLDSLHRFKEAEAIGRELVARRGMHFDFALLGDALMEQGRLDEAVEAYQKMIDLKPGPQSYSRAAHVRWLKGDLDGAIEMMTMAARATDPRDAESAAWTHTRLALYGLQAGDTRSAETACQAALQLQSDYAPALLAKGRVLLAEGKSGEAVDHLKRAADLNPLPEYQWTLADALRAEKRADEARVVEADLKARGAASDPRTFALYLASRGDQVEAAVRLAQQELDSRKDIFTLDALAWSLAAAGRSAEARVAIKQALAEGTKDARLFYHAGRIAALVSEKREAHRWFRKASAIKQMLLPSEREQLSTSLAAL
jgi:tetratricopeptide (TPR) repeat protein